ncbi:MAG: phosphate acyltransferase PlsX [Candidatus Brocadiia bacterium]
MTAPNNSVSIAIDAMGGDHAPEEVVKGALLVAPEFPQSTLLLVGDETAVNKIIGPNKPGNIQVIHAAQTIGMDEHPVEAIRQKKDSSLVKALGLVAAKKADAFISAGNTGACVAGASFMWGFLEGIKRPGIAIPLPTRKGLTYLIDAGANIFCHPIHLLHYGIMASVYCKHARNIANPRVGLLNIGEEDTKGNELVQETLKLYRKAPINFTGNIEGQHIFDGDCEVIVCEGFVGNVILKVTEGCVEFVSESFTNKLTQKKDSIPQFDTLMELLNNIRKQGDHSEFGGANLFGVNGVCIISHGRAKAKAIYNAIKVAINSAQHHVNDEIVQELQKTKLTWLDLLKSWKTHR